MNPVQTPAPARQPLTMIRHFAATATAGPAPSVSDLGCLTPREHNCALAVADGMTNRQIAAALFISPKTVEYHLSKIYTKLGIRSRSHLTRIVTTAQLT